jgi:hypothetical protein
MLEATNAALSHLTSLRTMRVLVLPGIALAVVRRTPGIRCQRAICSTLVSFMPLLCDTLARPTASASRRGRASRLLPFA